MDLPQTIRAPGWLAGCWRSRQILTPLFGLLLLLGAAHWAADEHARAQTELRRAETERYLAEFQQSAVADAWQHLSSAWRRERARQKTLLERLARSSGGEFDAARQNYRYFVLETIEDQRLTPAIATVHGFFARLGVCIRVGNCDPELVGRALGPAVWEFRNQHYDWFAFEGLTERVDATVAAIAPQPPGRAPAALALR